MPAGLLKKTCPFDVMRPKIWLGCASSTRFSVTLALLGCLKFTCALAPRLKLCQSMAARWLLWVTSKRAPLLPMTAWPATTWPPWGKVLAGGAAWAHPKPSANSAGKLRSTAISAPKPLAPAMLRLPRPRLSSLTATQVPLHSFQTRR